LVLYDDCRTLLVFGENVDVEAADRHLGAHVAEFAEV
jgi:hypothetical protein